MIFKKKKIVVDAFTFNENIAKYPIEKTSKYLPDWFKKLKPVHNIDEDNHHLKVSTFKKCDGIGDLINNTFALPLWADLSIIVNDDGIYEWKYPSPPYNYGMEQHPDYHLQGAFDPLVHAKIKSPWILKEKTGVNFCQIQGFYSFNKQPLQIPPGIVNYKYQHSTHINMFLERSKNYFFEVGTAMVYLLPMTDKKVEIKTHVVSKEEYNSLSQLSAPQKFMDAYKERKKCPIYGNN